MTDSRGYYKALKLSPGASIEEVKKAYRKLQMELHPSGPTRMRYRSSPKYQALSPEEQKAEEEKADLQVSQVNEAYKVLGDEKRKQEYDTETGEYATMNPFADFFSHRTRRSGPPKAEDIVADAVITLENAFNGVSKKYKISVRKICRTCSGKGGKDVQPCRKCNGRGSVVMQRISGIFVTRSEVECPECSGLGKIVKGPPCDTCRGDGTVKEVEVKEIHIPAGVKDRTELLLSRQGNEKPGCTPGDIVFHVNIKDMGSVYKRIDNHLVSPVDIDALTLLCGGVLYFSHPSGKKISVQIPPIRGRLDQVIVVPGEGFPSGRSRGDLYLQPNLINNQNTDRARISGAVKPELSKPAGEYFSAQGRLGHLPSESRRREESEYESAGPGGFAEDLMRGFGFF